MTFLSVCTGKCMLLVQQGVISLPYLSQEVDTSFVMAKPNETAFWWVSAMASKL